MLIVSRDAINHNSSVVICVPFTDLEHSTRIYPSQASFKKGVGGLRKDSVAMCDQIRALTVSRLRDRLGTFDAISMMEIDEKLKNALDLED